MRTVWPRWVAGLAAAGLLLSGCGGSPEPKPLPKESKSSPSESPSATPPVMPAAAKKKTKAGAEAFVRHYVRVINYAGRDRRTRELRTLCTRYVRQVHMRLADGIDEDLSQTAARIVGGGWIVVRIKRYGIDRDRCVRRRDHRLRRLKTGQAKGASCAKTIPASRTLQARSSFVLEASDGWPEGL